MAYMVRTCRIQRGKFPSDGRDGIPRLGGADQQPSATRGRRAPGDCTGEPDTWCELVHRSIERPLSSQRGNPVGSSMNNGLTVEVVEAGHDSLPEFGFRGSADAAQDRARHLREQAFDEVEPGTVLGG